MNNEKLYDGITGIREDIIERAETHSFIKEKRPVWKRWAALAACLCVIAGGAYGAFRLGLFGGMGGAGGGGGANEGTTYMSYAGPVFPLTTEGGAESLTAERCIDFDFSHYGNDEYRDNTESLVTDGYTIKNPTDSDVTVTALYPFAGSLGDSDRLMPTLTVDGAEQAAELSIGPYSGGFEGAWGGGGVSLNLAQLNSWEGYKALLEAGYIDSAFDALPELDIPVTVYELTGAAAPADTDATNPTLALSFALDYSKTKVLSYGFHGASFDREAGEMRQSFSVVEPGEYGYGRSYYLIILGDDIDGYTIQGYRDGGCDRGEEIDGVTAEVTRYETTLGEIMDEALTASLNRDGLSAEDAVISSRVSRAEYLGLAAELLEDYGVLSDAPAERYDAGWLEDIFSETISVQRVMYLSFELTVPAGGSVDVTARMVKDASVDFIGNHKNRNGYDMVTRLGSNIAFTSQTASVSNTDNIEIVAQSFGFDIANGVTEVALDIDAEHYWLEVRWLRKEEAP